MIGKLVEQINEADLVDLVTSAVAERKTIEYKQQLPNYNDAGKRELLADVSSFANTAGGDLVFGMTERTGVPTGAPGVQIVDRDQEILRIESIIRDGLSPRIRLTTQVVPLKNCRHVLIIRVERSWYGPHRVTFKGDSRFYGRTTNGKYELDVTDLRNAFLFANTVTDKIAAFKSERIIALGNGQSPVPLAAGPKLVMHCIPIESFGGKPQYDVLILRDIIKPMYWDNLPSFGPRVNFEGLLCVATIGEPHAYTQVYRNGVIEAVCAGLLSQSDSPDIITAWAYERTVLKYLPTCFQMIGQLGCSAPVLVGVTLIGVRGMTSVVASARGYGGQRGEPIDRDILMLPEALAEDISAPPGPLLKPMFDLVWNACGFSSSPYFDAAGNWTGK